MGGDLGGILGSAASDPITSVIRAVRASSRPRRSSLVGPGSCTGARRRNHRTEPAEGAGGDVGPPLRLLVSVDT
jgi:hypothetical protein